MKITVDTNVLVRLLMADDEAQNHIAIRTIENASLIAISVHALCELVWVLDRYYSVDRGGTADAIRRLIGAPRVVVNRPAIEAGLKVLDAGGDFADGVIAHDGGWLGGEVFVSFDKKAVALITRQGKRARIPT